MEILLILLAIVVVIVLIALFLTWGDIQRYRRIRKM